MGFAFNKKACVHRHAGTHNREQGSLYLILLPFFGSVSLRFDSVVVSWVTSSMSWVTSSRGRRCLSCARQNTGTANAKTHHPSFCRVGGYQLRVHGEVTSIR